MYLVRKSMCQTEANLLSLNRKYILLFWSPASYTKGRILHVSHKGTADNKELKIVQSRLALWNNDNCIQFYENGFKQFMRVINIKRVVNNLFTQTTYRRVIGW